MNYSHCLICSILLMSVPVRCVSGTVSKETIEFMGQKRSFHVFVPKGLPPSGTVPLLVTLHGSGGDGAGMVDRWKGLAEEEKIILVGPDSRDPAFWAAPVDGPDFMYEIIERLKKTYPIDPRRVYLFGHSSGAVFSLLTAMWESQYFAAAAVHAGALEGFEAADGIAAAKRKIPIAIFAGTADPIFPIKTVRTTRDTLRDAEFPILLIEIPGHNHNYSAVSSKINRQVWDCLKQHVLPAEPHYETGIARNPAIAKEFEGTWEGALVLAGESLRFVLKMANNDSGASAVIISPDQGGAEIPVTIIRQRDAKVTLLVMAGVGGEYRGEINKAGTELAGRWSQSGNDSSLKLKKSHTRAKP
jgi:predicted esterase